MLRAVSLILAPLSCLVAPGPARSVQAASANAETLCGVMVNRGGTVHTLNLPALRVLVPTAQEGRFAPTLPDGVVAILCGRASILPAEHDDKVLALGIPFYILEAGNPGRLGVLEINQGQFRFRMMEGTLRPEEEQPLQGRLNEFQSRLQAR